MVMNDNPCLDPTLAATAARFAALGSTQRLAVLRALVRAGPEGLSIGELGDRCGLTGSTLTHHMKALASAGLVTQIRQGRNILCTPVDCDDLRGLSDFLMEECASASARRQPEVLERRRST